MDTQQNTLTQDSHPLYISSHRTAWKEELVRFVVSVADCSFITKKEHGSRQTQYLLVGRIYNIALARTLWVWFINHIHMLAKTHVHVGNGKIALQSYCLGYIAGMKNMTNVSPHAGDEARHYVQLTNFDIRYVEPCSNFCVDQSYFNLGEQHGAKADWQQSVGNVTLSLS